MPPSPQDRAAQARARRRAQRRLASNLKRGRPALPQSVTGPARARRRKLAKTEPAAIERAIGDKPSDMGGQFRNDHKYSAATVRYMAGKMTPAQIQDALTYTTNEYRDAASRQGIFNVFWYHTASIDWLNQAYADSR